MAKYKQPEFVGPLAHINAMDTSVNTEEALDLLGIDASKKSGTKNRIRFGKTGTFSEMDIDKLTRKMEDARPVGTFERRE